MELFDFVNAIFCREGWEKISRVDKDRYFFMTNRFMSINFPRQASMFNMRHIPKAHVMDYWHRQLSIKYTKIPSWVYTKGPSSEKRNASHDIKIDQNLARFFCEKNKCTLDDLELLKTVAPDDLKDELKELSALIESRLDKS